AALPGLTVGVALVVDRRSIVLVVQVLVAAGDGGGAAAAVDRRGRPLLADVVGLGGVALVEQDALGETEAGGLGDVLGQVGPHVVPVDAHRLIRPQGADDRVQGV